MILRAAFFGRMAIRLPAAVMSRYQEIAASSRPYQRSGLHIEAVVVAMGQAGYAAGTLILLKVLTTLLPASEYGRVTVGLVIIGTMNQLFYLPMSNGLLRFFSVYRDGGALSALGRAHDGLHARAASIVVGAGGAIALALWVYGFRPWSVLVGMSALLSVSDGLLATSIALMTATRHRKITAVAEGIQPWTRAGGAAAATFLVVPSAVAALGGYFAANILLALILRLYLLSIGLGRWGGTRQPLSPQELVTARDLRRYVSSFALWGGATSISVFWDRCLLQAFFGSAAVGTYAAIFQLASAAPVFLMRTLNRLGAPLIFDTAGVGKDAHRLRTASGMVSTLFAVAGFLFAPIFAISLFAPRFLVALGTSAKYAQYAALFPVLIAASFLAEAATMLRTQGLAANRPELYTRLMLLQAALASAMGIVGAVTYGLQGVACAALTANGVFLLLVVRVNRRMAELQ